MIIGALLAWLVTRTDLPWKKPIRALVMASFVTPPFLGAFAWTLARRTQRRFAEQTLPRRDRFGRSAVQYFHHAGADFRHGALQLSLVFSMIANVCELISSDLEDAAEILGANKWRTAWTVTLPLALPALIGGFILAFLQSLSLFGAPAILGLPAGLHTITTQIWALFQYPPRLDMAAAFSVPLLLATMALIAVQKKILGRKGYSTVGRQRRAETLDPPWLGPYSGAAFGARHSLAFGLPALLDSAESGAFQGLGDAVDLG